MRAKRHEGSGRRAHAAGAKAPVRLGGRMGRREAERAVAALLDDYQEVLDELGCGGRFSRDEAMRRVLTEEEWLLHDASRARIDGIVEALGLLGYAAWRDAGGCWHVART